MLIITCCDEIRSLTVRVAANPNVKVNSADVRRINESLRALGFCSEGDLNAVSTKLLRGFGHARSLLVWGRVTVTGDEMRDLLNTIRQWPDRCVSLSIDGAEFRAFSTGAQPAATAVFVNSTTVTGLSRVLTNEPRASAFH